MVLKIIGGRSRARLTQRQYVNDSALEIVNKSVLIYSKENESVIHS